MILNSLTEVPKPKKYIPTINGKDSEENVFYFIRVGTYSVFNKLCIACCEIHWAAGTGTGALCISAPVRANADPDYKGASGSATVIKVKGDIEDEHNMCRIERGEKHFTIFIYKKNEPDQQLLYAPSGVISLGITYETEDAIYG